MNIFLPLLASVILFAAFLLIRTLNFRDHVSEVMPIPVIDVQQELIAKHLSEIIQIPSISKMDAKEVDQKPFILIKNWIAQAFPLFSAGLERTVINEYSLLFKWAGTDSKLDPVLFNAHMDVVPVDEETLGEWKVDPFSGEIFDGFVWGRGALDMKNQLVAILDAIEGLLKENYYS